MQIDVMIVVENSEEMKKDDPSRLFIVAAKMFVTLLGKNDRAGVISYTDKAEVVNELTNIGNDTNREALFRAVDNITWQAGKYNAVEAIKSAVNVLTKEMDRKTGKAIILLYDTKSNVEEAIEQSSIIESLTVNGIKLFAIAVGGKGHEKPDKQSVKSDDEFYKATGGYRYQTRSATGIYMMFTSVFENLKSPMMMPLEKKQAINIDDSIETITFVIKKSSPASKISLDDPDGVKYLPTNKMDNVSWLVSDLFDTIKINDPAHGMWKINIGYGRENKAYISTSLKLITNIEDSAFGGKEATHHVAGKIFLLEAWFKLDDLPLNLKEMLHNITVKADIVGPDGDKSELSLNARLGTKEGSMNKVLYSDQFTPMKEGCYEVKITATGNGLDRSRPLSLVVQKHGAANAVRDKKKVQDSFSRYARLIYMPIAKKGEMSFKSSVAYFIIINILGLTGLIIYYRKKERTRFSKSYKRQKNR